MKKQIKKYVYNSCPFAEVGKENGRHFFIVDFNTPMCVEATILASLIRKHFNIKRVESYPWSVVFYY